MFHLDIPLEGPDTNIADIAFAFSSGKDKRRALEDLCMLLRGSDVFGGLVASQQQIQWDAHFKGILSDVLEIVRAGNVNSSDVVFVLISSLCQRTWDSNQSP